MSNGVVVSIKNVKKRFDLPHEKEDSIKLKLINQLRGKSRNATKEYNALQGVDLDIKKGDFIGILGRNGAGKSTLLKIIAEIYQPTSGSVKVKGKLVPFIELGVGFNPNLTGRDNVYLNGAMLGFDRKEIDTMYDDIVAFAELEEFMDQKLKNYSSGMQVRLAFSVAIKANADVLLLDEVLAVGDAAFQKKCYDYFNTLKDDGKTVILVTHSMANVRKFCTRAAVIDDGKVVFDGSAEDAAEKYLDLFRMSSETKEEKDLEEVDNEVKIVGVESICKPDNVDIVVDLLSAKDNDDIKLALRVLNSSYKMIAGINTQSVINPTVIRLEGGKVGRVKLSMPNIFGNGTFSVDVRVGPNEYTGVIHDKISGVAHFINQKDEVYYPVALPARVSMEKAKE